MDGEVRVLQDADMKNLKQNLNFLKGNAMR